MQKLASGIIGTTLAVAMSVQSAFADTAQDCLDSIGEDKAQFASDMSLAMKSTFNPTAIGASLVIDTSCFGLKTGFYTLENIDECFKATRAAFQMFDRQSGEQLLGAAEWERIRQRTQEFKERGTCTDNLGHRLPKNDTI